MDSFESKDQEKAEDSNVLFFLCKKLKIFFKIFAKSAKIVVANLSYNVYNNICRKEVDKKWKKQKK